MSINSFLVVLFTVVLLLLAALFGTLSFLSHTQEEIAESEHRRFESYKLADQIRQSSDDLTQMARLYVVTGEQRFADYFQEILDIRHGKRPRPENYDLVYWELVAADGQRPQTDGAAASIKDLMIEQGFSVLEFSKLSEAEDKSDALVRLEKIAMNAVQGRFADGRGGFTRSGAPDLDLARSIMFGEEYLREKAAIMVPINEFLVLLSERTQTEVAELRQRGDLLTIVALAICFVTFAVSVGAVFVLRKRVIRPLGMVSAATQRVAGGDYEQGIDYRANDEVGHLVAAFNRMVDSTRTSVARLHDANQALRDNQAQLEQERNKSEELLLNILPVAIATRLKEGETTIADEFPEVSVMFVDLVGFTQLTDALGPHEIVKLLNDIFALFDRRLEDFGLEKIKTIGDSYMVVGGLPEPVADHAHRMADFALAIREDFARFIAARGLDVKIRMGIHSGTAVAGVVGTKKFAYDLWGDVVNVASRIESTGAVGEIHVSEQYMVRLKDTYQFEPHGSVELKGKGKMQTFFLKGRRYGLRVVDAG